MSSYQKFTLKTFKGKLENGDYENATGANRAIGKTQELSEGDKAKAKAMVAAHFGTEVVKTAKPAKKAKAPAKKAKKAAKKAVVKKPAKKVAKVVSVAKPAKKTAKRAKKAAKKAAKRTKVNAEPTDAEPAILTEVAPPARAKALKVLSALPAVVATSVNERVDTIKMMGDIISYVDVVLKTMELSKRLYPKGNIDGDVTTAQSVISKAVNVLNGVVSPMSTSDEAVVVTAKPESKKGKSKPKTNAASAVSAAPSEVPVEESAIDESKFTDEEREELRVARKVQPAIDKKHGPTAALVTA
jgi:hypothetical protein